MRPAAVVVTVGLLAGLAMVCGTVLILAGRVDGGSFALLLGSFVSPVVMILLSAQVADVQKKVNGQMTAMVQKIPDQGTASTKDVESA